KLTTLPRLVCRAVDVQRIRAVLLLTGLARAAVVDRHVAANDRKSEGRVLEWIRGMLFRLREISDPGPHEWLSWRRRRRRIVNGQRLHVRAKLRPARKTIVLCDRMLRVGKLCAGPVRLPAAQQVLRLLAKMFE